MRRSRLQRLGAMGLIVLALALAYSNSFQGAFILDDTGSIRTNDSILHLWPITGPLNPPGEGQTVQGRPLVNLTLAINYAFGGYRVFGYHLMNLMIHIMATLLLFGIVRRVTKNLGVALVTALLWGLHPLQTEAVTYIIQRAESLMALFYLLTLYGFLRATEPGVPDPGYWKGVSLGACLLGMASKEVMVSAPMVVFLFDRAFVAGSFRQAWLARRTYYLGLAATWLLLGALVLTTGNRGATSGIGSGVPVLHYWITQPPAICHYLGLIIWPRHLIFDYGTPWITRPLAYLSEDLFVLLLVGLSLVGLWRNKPWGFCGIWFFAILAPTSIIPGNRQVLSEHRLYLALAPCLILGALALVKFPLKWRWMGGVTAMLVACGLGYVTYARNAVYLTPDSIYGDTVAKIPGNPFNQANYGTALLFSHRYWEAEVHLRRAIEILPHYPIAEDNLGSALSGMGRFDEAKVHFLKAIALDPTMASAHQNMGFALLREGKTDEAIGQIKLALKLEPKGGAIGYDNLGSALASVGKIDEAVEAFRQSVRIDPKSQTAHMNLGNALVAKGRMAEGLEEMSEAVRLGPPNAAAYFNRAVVLCELSRTPEALVDYAHALSIEPRNPNIHQALGDVLLQSNRVEEAADEYRTAISEAPTRPIPHYKLGKVLLLQGDQAAGVAEIRTSLGLDPKYKDASETLKRLGESP